MSGAFLEIDLDTATARAGVGAMAKALANPRPMMEDIGAEVESSTLNRFETNIDPDGVPWPQSLHSKLTGKPTLVGEGFLRDSTHYEVESDFAVVIGEGGVAAAYARIHQEGGVITAKSADGLSFNLADGAHVVVQSVRIPKRSSLGLSADDKVGILDIVGQHLASAAASGVI